jgi:hypothetical protein
LWSDLRDCFPQRGLEIFCVDDVGTLRSKRDDVQKWRVAKNNVTPHASGLFEIDNTRSSTLSVQPLPNYQFMVTEHFPPGPDNGIISYNPRFPKLYEVNLSAKYCKRCRVSVHLGIPCRPILATIHHTVTRYRSV